ncbi:type II toxin-antitoxin system Phd/YefM family antitoxin [Actinacidiphila acididurans]|uniref:Antitoxin n=1 Tax=Actinacidiphila acididurans TaxID=2784346 RepID=A0ABS2U4W0_9ACTN|nr:type II toxin-antitoxin system Phd/YefM family antitoxin [Actinacidiphila acididurans]MBM9509540.1 type II toxin-antitoxin system Phd/YefM family antitoxin [Actinacidiphila acididurans]
MTHDVPVTQARAQLAELINRVVYGGEQVVLTRHGKPLVALVSAADLQRLRDLDEAAEEQVISTVSTAVARPSATGERRRFGIAARHDDPAPGDHRP